MTPAEKRIACINAARQLSVAATETRKFAQPMPEPTRTFLLDAIARDEATANARLAALSALVADALTPSEGP